MHSQVGGAGGFGREPDGRQLAGRAIEAKYINSFAVFSGVGAGVDKVVAARSAVSTKCHGGKQNRREPSHKQREGIANRFHPSYETAFGRCGASSGRVL